MKALDLFCGAGGASMGLHRAGFDVTGVDIKPQPRYPFKFIQADALEYPLEGFDFIWASPPCQAYSIMRHLQKGKAYVDLIPQTRRILVASQSPWVIENVWGASLGEAGNVVILCGTMFGLQTPSGSAELRRHRVFEANFPIGLRPPCQHGSGVITVVGHTHVVPRSQRRTISVTGNTPQTNVIRNRSRKTYSAHEARHAMGIEWMSIKELSQAIPPAYSEFIGKQAMEVLCSGLLTQHQT